MNLEISKFSLTENIKLLSLRTVNISTASRQTTLDPYVSPAEALQHVDAWRKKIFKCRSCVESCV